jgi:hypothetical protein
MINLLTGLVGVVLLIADYLLSLKTGSKNRDKTG